MAVEQGKLKTPEENYEDAALELALYRMLLFRWCPDYLN